MIDRLRRLPLRRRLTLGWWLVNALLAAAVLAFSIRG